MIFPVGKRLFSFTLAYNHGHSAAIDPKQVDPRNTTARRTLS